MKRFCVLLLALALTMVSVAAVANAEVGSVKSSFFGGPERTIKDGDGDESDPDIGPESGGVDEPDDDVDDLVDDADGGCAPEAIQAAVAAYLEESDWTYTIEDDKINFSMTIDSKIGRLTYQARFFENGYTVYAYPSLKADEENMTAIAEFLHRANYGMRNGNFELDFRDGEIRYKSYVDCSDGLPGDTVIFRSIYVPGSMFEDYGDGLLKVSFDMMTPEEAIEEIEG